MCKNFAKLITVQFGLFRPTSLTKPSTHPDLIALPKVRAKVTQRDIR